MVDGVMLVISLGAAIIGPDVSIAECLHHIRLRLGVISMASEEYDDLKRGDDVQVYEPGRGWYCYATFRFYGGDKKCVVRIGGDTKSIIKPVEHVRRSK